MFSCDFATSHCTTFTMIFSSSDLHTYLFYLAHGRAETAPCYEADSITLWFYTFTLAPLALFLRDALRLASADARPGVRLGAERACSETRGVCGIGTKVKALIE